MATASRIAPAAVLHLKVFRDHLELVDRLALVEREGADPSLRGSGRDGP
jgi:hypothetical protein